MFEELGLTPAAPLSVPTLFLNLLLCALLSFLLAWHFIRFGRTFSNRVQLAYVLPFISLATVFIISVVKSSLALSLGLVGALSIVRFRTPIKEPEELAYLFMSIALGLGLGADQRLPTVVAFTTIMIIVLTRSLLHRRDTKHNLYLNLEVPAGGKEGEKSAFGTINGVLAQHVQVADMRRLDVRDGVLQATYYVDCEDSQRMEKLMESLNRELPGIGVSFVEQKGLPWR